MRALAIDGDAARLRILAERLELLGLTVTPAGTARAGINTFIAGQPDLVVIGLDLTDCSETELVRRLRALESTGEWTPILLLTTAVHGDDIASALAAGADDFLFMPVADAVLAAKIRAVRRLMQVRLSLLAATRKLDIANRELRRLSAVDALTGVANRRQFDATLSREWQRSMRAGSELSLIIADVDHFKLFNDTLGHPAGDACLGRIAAILAATVERGGDLVARYGGEEFALILPETGRDGAGALAERLRQKVAGEAITHPAAPLGRVSMSFGVAAAVAMPETAPESLLRAADAALYRAKRDGRDRVVIDASGEGEAVDIFA